MQDDTLLASPQYDSETSQRDGEDSFSAAGAVAHDVQDGIARFLRFAEAETETERERLRRLNGLADEIGWESALRTVYANDAGMVRYVTDEARASFIDLLPLDASSDVLEVGPGLGQFTPLLARRAKSVYALEVVPGQAGFVTRRCRQQGIANVHVAIGGDDCRLPYQDASFDVVVLNLVFEWCGSRCAGEAFVEMQRRLLAETARVLRAEGALYLTTKNRFALRYLIGKRDEHCHNMRFGNALPRWLSRWLLQRKSLPKPQGLLHSHDALKAMLSGSGFGDIRSFWAAPEMRSPTRYVPTDTASVASARRTDGFVQGEMRSTQALMRLIPSSLVKHFTPGLTFLASKSS